MITTVHAETAVAAVGRSLLTVGLAAVRFCVARARGVLEDQVPGDIRTEQLATFEGADLLAIVESFAVASTESPRAVLTLAQ